MHRPRVFVASLGILVACTSRLPALDDGGTADESGGEDESGDEPEPIDLPEHSGARLRARYLVPEGSSADLPSAGLRIGWYDTELEIDCE